MDSPLQDLHISEPYQIKPLENIGSLVELTEVEGVVRDSISELIAGTKTP